MEETQELERLTIINRLLASFPSTQGGQGDDALDGYLIGTREVPVDFLALAAQRFLAGQVPGQHMAFPPSPAQLATEARDHWYKALEAARREQARLVPPKPREPEISEEERKRVGAGLAQLAVDLGASLRTDEAEKAAARREASERDVKRRIASGEFVEIKGSSYPVSQTLLKRLGVQYAVGDRDGDRDAH